MNVCLLLEHLADLVGHLIVARRLARFDVVADPVALPGPVLRQPHLAPVGAVILFALKGERIRLAVIGASPGEHGTALLDGHDLQGLPLSREAAELAAVAARRVIQAVGVRSGEGVELLELILREIRDEADKLRVVSVELRVQRATSALAVTGELAASGANLFVAAMLVMRDQLGILLSLLCQVAIGRLGTDPNGLMKELAAEMTANGGERFLVVALVVRHLLGIVVIQVRKDLHGVLEELVGVNVALKSGSGTPCTMRGDRSGDSELIAALLHARAPLEILLLVLLGLLGLFLLSALLLEGEFVQPALILLDTRPVLLVGGGNGVSGGHALLAWIALWYFDSTSFPYPSLWRVFLSIFFKRRKCRESRHSIKKPGVFLGFLMYVCIFWWYESLRINTCREPPRCTPHNPGRISWRTRQFPRAFRPGQGP